MSKSKFDKAVSIVQNLPKDGPIKPTQDDQLYVRSRDLLPSALPTDDLLGTQFYSYYKQGEIVLYLAVRHPGVTGTLR